MYKLTLATIALTALLVIPVLADTEDEFENVRTEIWRELLTPFRAGEVPELSARRQRLNDLFNAVPGGFANEFYDELGTRKNGGEFSDVFHGELSTAVRQELLAILLEKAALLDKAASPELSEQPLERRPPLSFFGNEPLPHEWEVEFQFALLEMESALPYLNSVRGARMACVLDLLSDPTVDDRVAFWRDVCPEEGHNLQLLLPGCPFTGLRPDAQTLHENMRSVAEVENNGVRLGALRHLRATLMRFSDDAIPDPSFSALQLKLLNDEIMNTHTSLSAISNSGFGGGSGMPRRLQFLLAWIGKQWDTESSVLSCFRS